MENLDVKASAGDVGPHVYLEAVKNSQNQIERQEYLDSYLSAVDRNRKQFLESLYQARLPRIAGIPATAADIADFVIYDARFKLDPEWIDANIARRKGESRHPDYLVNEAYINVGRSLKFFLKGLGIDSMDGKHMSVKAAVHVGEKYNNSYYTDGTINLGDGDGVLFKDDAADLTVVAHELGHGIIEKYLGGLIYWGQSGALNESLADLLGISAMQYLLGEEALPESTWLFNQIGMVPYRDQNGNLVRPALRSLKAPGTAYVNHPIIGTDPQPADMSKYYDGAEDNYGVHINSGIPNHAFYLAATKLGGKGWDVMLKIWIEATRVLPAKTDFKTFAQTTIELAQKMFAAEPRVARAVRQAWNGVRVLGPRAVEVQEVYELTRNLAQDLELPDDSVSNVFAAAWAAEKQLEKTEGVLRVAPGFEISTDLEINLNLIVYVSRRQKEWSQIPAQIEGYPVKVVYRAAGES